MDALPLPLSLHQAERYAIAPALDLLPDSMDSKEARCLLLAIGLQESGFQTRRQKRGPARGLWQFERGGGVSGVLRHPASAALAKRVCAARGVTADSPSVYLLLEHDDILAAAFARLLLWTDPAPLPALGQADAAWDYYESTWRPGKPHPERWAGHYAAALKAVRA